MEIDINNSCLLVNMKIIRTSFHMDNLAETMNFKIQNITVGVKIFAGCIFIYLIVEF